MYKRKTPYQGKRNPQRKYARRGTVASYNKGYVRTTGFYGRYNRHSVRSSSVSELKFKDNAFITTITSAGVILPSTNSLVNIAVGTGPNERIGRQIKVKSINAYLTLQKNSSSYATDTIRIMLVLDTQCNGTAPAITDILQTASVNSFRNMANSKRFVVLKDSEINITSATYDGTNFATVHRQLEFFRKVNYSIEYDQNMSTGAISTIRSNNLFLVALTNYASISVNGTVRIRYDD